MADVTRRPSDTRARRRAIGAVGAVVACVGCCSLPFVAGASIAGVAICSARFLGVAFASVATVAAIAAAVFYRARKRRVPDSVPVTLAPSRTPSEPS